MCVCVFVCVCMCLSIMYVCTYVCMYLCMCIHVYVCILYVCVYVWMCLCLCVCMFICMYVCMYLCVYVCICVCGFTNKCVYVCLWYAKVRERIELCFHSTPAPSWPVIGWIWPLNSCMLFYVFCMIVCMYAFFIYLSMLNYCEIILHALKVLVTEHLF